MKLSLVLFITLVVALAGCSNADQARDELAQMNIAYTADAFIENAREGNADAVKLFFSRVLVPFAHRGKCTKGLFVARIHAQRRIKNQLAADQAARVVA